MFYEADYAVGLLESELFMDADASFVIQFGIARQLAIAERHGPGLGMLH